MGCKASVKKRTSQMLAGGGGREEGKGRTPPLRCKHGTLPDVRTSHPPAPVPRPLPRTPLLMFIPVAHFAKRAVLWGAPARRGGSTGRSKVFHASTRPNTAPPTHLAPARVTNTPPQTNLAPNHTRGALEEAQRGTCRPGTLRLSAPSSKQ